MLKKNWQQAKESLDAYFGNFDGYRDYKVLKQAVRYDLLSVTAVGDQAVFASAPAANTRNNDQPNVLGKHFAIYEKLVISLGFVSSITGTILDMVKVKTTTDVEIKIDKLIRLQKTIILPYVASILPIWQVVAVAGDSAPWDITPTVFLPYAPLNQIDMKLTVGTAPVAAVNVVCALYGWELSVN
jgi:hypothetical protein